jgi:hypothetical protein
MASAPSRAFLERTILKSGNNGQELDSRLPVVLDIS